jgi:hypothetical protein
MVRYDTVGVHLVAAGGKPLHLVVLFKGIPQDMLAVFGFIHD